MVHVLPNVAIIVAQHALAHVVGLVQTNVKEVANTLAMKYVQALAYRYAHQAAIMLHTTNGLNGNKNKR